MIMPYIQRINNLVSFNPKTQVLNKKLEKVNRFVALVQKLLAFLKESCPSLFGRVKVINPDTYNPQAILDAFNKLIDQVKGASYETLTKLHTVFNKFVDQNQLEDKRDTKTVAAIDKRISLLQAKKFKTLPLPPKKHMTPSKYKTITGPQRAIKNLNLSPNSFASKLTKFLYFDVARAKTDEIQLWAKACNEFIENHTGSLITQSPQTLVNLMNNICALEKHTDLTPTARNLLKSARENLLALF